jgi:hypothetical protein
MRLLAAAALLLLAARSAHAQAAPARAAATARAAAGPVPARAVLLEDIEQSRQNVLKYLDAAPDSMLGYRPTPGVRTFAQQIEHAAASNPYIVGEAWRMRPRLQPDSTATRTKAGLRALVVAAYDEFARMVREVPAAQLAAQGTAEGSTKTNWRWVATALDHATWTLGQTVPYLRANGVTPPQYLPF